MAGEQFRLVFGNDGELGFEGFGDTGVKCASRIAQEGAVGRVLHQRVLEQIFRMRRLALPEQQTGLQKTINFRFEFPFWLVRYRSQQSIRELLSNHRSDLRHFLGVA